MVFNGLRARRQIERTPMKRATLGLLAAGVAALALMLLPAETRAGIDINIGIKVPLPEVVIASPPAVVVIPGTYVYFAPDVEVDIFFYRGHWFRTHKGKWYSSGDYNGPWIVITDVPSVFADLPPGFRDIPPGHQRIPYGQLKKNWKDWEKSRKWDGAKHAAKKKHGRGKGKGKH